MDSSHTLIAPSPLARSADVAVAGLRNLVTHRLYLFKEFQLAGHPKRLLAIGRTPMCDIALNDLCVSSVHCIVERLDNGSYLLRDNQSTNGTFILAQGLTEKVEAVLLTVGVRVVLGNTTMITVNEHGRTLISATTETEFRREAYHVYGSTIAAGQAIKKSAETIRRALRRAGRTVSRRDHE